MADLRGLVGRGQGWATAVGTGWAPLDAGQAWAGSGPTTRHAADNVRPCGSPCGGDKGAPAAPAAAPAHRTQIQGPCSGRSLLEVARMETVVSPAWSGLSQELTVMLRPAAWLPNHTLRQGGRGGGERAAVGRGVGAAWVAAAQGSWHTSRGLPARAQCCALIPPRKQATSKHHASRSLSSQLTGTRGWGRWTV